jgi:hypothetical protein
VVAENIKTFSSTAVDVTCPIHVGAKKLAMAFEFVDFFLHRGVHQLLLTFATDFCRNKNYRFQRGYFDGTPFSVCGGCGTML